MYAKMNGTQYVAQEAKINGERAKKAEKPRVAVVKFFSVYSLA